MSTPSLKDSLQLNKPRRTPDHKTKSHVVKVNDGGTEKLIRFGQQGVKTAGKPKDGESQTQKNRRKSFKARHAQNIKKGKTSAAYWADRVKWAEGGSVGYDSDRIDAMAEEILNFANGGEVTLGDLVQARETVDTVSSDDDTILDTNIREFGLDPNVERKTTFFPDVSREESYEDINEVDVTAPQALYDAVETMALFDAVDRGYEPTQEEILNAAMNMTGGSLFTSAIKGPAKKAGETVLGMGVAPKVSATPKSKTSTSVEGFFDKDGNPTKKARETAYKRARQKIENKKPKPLSEFLGDMNLEGKNKLAITEADRSATIIGGGPGFIHIGPELKKMADEAGVKLPDRKLITPEEALNMSQDFGDPAWGVMDKGTASRLINQNIKEGELGNNLIWTTLLGTDIQHMSNPVVFEKLTNKFKKAVSEGKLPPEQAAKMNHNLKLLGFPDGADIRDPFIWDMIDEVGTFMQRKSISRMIRGQSVELEPEVVAKINRGELPKAVPMGGVKSRIIDTEEILRDSVEPELLGPNLRIKKSDEPDVPSMTVGPYAYSLDNKTYNNPAVHPGFPQILTGQAKQGSFEGVPFEDAFPEFMEKMKQKFELRKQTNPENKQKFDRSFYGMSAKRGIAGEGLPTQKIDEKYLSNLQKKGYAEGGLVIEEELDRIFSDTSANTEEIEIQEIETSEESPSIIRDFIDNIEFTGGETNVKYGTDREKVMMWDGEKLTPKTITTDMLMGATQGGLTTTVGDNVVVDISGLGLKGFSDFNDTTIEGTPITGGLTYIGDQGDIRLEGVLDPNEREFINANLSGSYNMGDNRLSGNINYDPASGNITNIVGELQRMLSENSTGYGKVDYDPINEKTSGKVGYEYRVPNTGSRINVEGSVDPYRDNETKVMANFTKGFNRGGSYDADKINMMADQILETYNV